MSKSDLLNWNDFRFFVVVAQSGSLARAAETLGVNHSTVFRRLNSLEEALDAKLFNRLNDGYQLSEAGLDILRYVEDMSDRVNDIRRLLDSQNEGMVGPINLTAPHNLAYRFIPSYIKDFQKLYPGVSVNLLVTNSDCNLSRREADLAIRASPAPPDNLVGQKLFSLKWGAYAGPSYIAEYGRPQGIDELGNHRIISAHIDLVFLPAFQWVQSNIAAGNVVARCNDLVSMSALAVAGVGIALLPDDQAKPELERLFTIDFGRASDIWVLIHPDMRGCRRLKEFKDYLIERFRNDPVFKEHSA